MLAARVQEDVGRLDVEVDDLCIFRGPQHPKSHGSRRTKI